MADKGVSIGSDYIDEMFCEHCYKKEQKHVTAEGFCVNCVKYFCTTCLGYHNQFLPDHIQQDKNSMPVDFYMEKCNKHPQELLKFYCITCKDIACLTCKTTFHTACKNIHHLPRLAAEFDAVKECRILEENLDLIEEEADDIKKSIDNHRESVEKQNTNVIKVVKEQRQEVEKIFNNFEEELDNLHKANKNTLDLGNTKNDLLKAEIQGLKTDVRTLKNSHQKCKVYLETKKVADKQEIIAETLKNQLDKDLNRYSYTKAKEKVKPENFGKVTLKPLEIVKMNKISCFNVLLILACAIILVSPIMTTMYKKIDKLSSLQTKNKTDFKSISTDEKDHQPVNDGNPVLDSPTMTQKSETIEKLSLKTLALEKISEKHLESLPKNIEVHDLSYFSEHVVFSIAYGFNSYEDDVKDSSFKEHFIESNVQVHNLTENKIIHSFHQQGIGKIIKVDDKTVAAKFVNKVELWRITEHQSNIERTVTYILNTAGQYCGNIHYRVGNLFVKCYNLESKQYTIKQLDIIGYKVTNFNINSEVFDDMTVSPNGKTIYISYRRHNLVKSYTPEGHLMAEYRNDSLRYPGRMTVDSKGNLFVIGKYGTRFKTNIFYVSPDLTHGYELIKTDIEFADSITYNEIHNSLYISSIHDRSINVFKIKI
jgi:hypothetical protein